MVVCKYFIAGGCRFGNSCRYEHTNPTNYTPSIKGNVLTLVAEEALAAERGRQWPLSCFSPSKDYACFPGLDDVSPEEVRWEMYQAQKNGTVDQTKLQFQQLCQDMRSKRELLKNPSNEISTILDQIHKSNREPDFANKSFTASSANPFGAPSTFSSTTSPSIFGRQASFGGAPVFDSQTPTTNSIFGGGTPSTSSVFGGSQTMPGFSTANPQNPSSSSSIFGNFTGTTTQTGNVFSTTQTTSSPFGSVPQASNNVFGTPSSSTTTNSIFGTSQQQSAIPTNPSSSIFGQQKPPTSSSSSAFGGAPVFGSAPTFSSTQPTTGFGAQSIFSNQTTNGFTTNNPTTSATTFGSSAAGSGTNTFASLVAPQSNNTFQNTGQSGASPFGNNVPSSTTMSPFGSSASSTSGFGSFSSTPVFTNVSNTFSNVNSTSDAGSPFGTNNFTSQAGYGSAPGYTTMPSTPFASTTATSTISNPFAQNSQNTMALGVTASGTTFGGMSAGPVGGDVDPNVYTNHADLTDEEKEMFMADEFVLGKIPINPPSIELR